MNRYTVYLTLPVFGVFPHVTFFVRASLYDAYTTKDAIARAVADNPLAVNCTAERIGINGK